MTQTSIVFSERTWTGVDPTPGDGRPDIDDCWVLSALQAVHACAPWLYLPSAKVFRHAAGDPDDGHTDGGSIPEIVAGVVGLYPEFAGKLDRLKGASWADLMRALRAGHVASVALSLGVLPRRLRYTTSAVPHQSTLAVKGDRLLFANPMAPMGSRWDEVDAGDVRPAILDYGKGSVFAIAFPTDETMAPFYRPVAGAIDEEARRLAGRLVTEARAAGFADARTKASQAVARIEP